MLEMAASPWKVFATNQWWVKVCQTVTGGSLYSFSTAKILELATYFKHVYRVDEKVFLPRILLAITPNDIHWTNRACAITFEKLSLRILIKDVTKRMFVMQTKISYARLGRCSQSFGHNLP